LKQTIGLPFGSVGGETIAFEMHIAKLRQTPFTFELSGRPSVLPGKFLGGLFPFCHQKVACGPPPAHFSDRNCRSDAEDRHRFYMSMMLPIQLAFHGAPG
jgi:hypothetical protein